MTVHSTPVATGAEVKGSAQWLFAETRQPQRIAPELHVELTEHTYLPKVHSPRSDWVASVAIPAFEAYAKRCADQGRAVGDFCTIGTGAGLDALAAIEILNPQRVTVTDLHATVVERALSNIRRNLLAPETVQLDGRVGDLATPLLDGSQRFDLIYENLPNIPLLEGIDLNKGINSSSFIISQRSDLPESVANDLLELHYLFLCQAHALLTPGGRVLSSIGARVPLTSLLQMPSHANYQADILLYTWKIQSEPKEVVGSYAVHQQKGRGPFYFYPVEVLREVFDRVPVVDSLERAMAVESQLSAHAIDAETAIALVQSGQPIGHTVAVVQATPNSAV